MLRNLLFFRKWIIIKPDRQLTHKVTLKRFRVTIVTAKKAISDKYSECASLFLSYLSGMKIASFLRCIILPSVSCPALPYFLTLSTIVKKSQWIQKVCFDFFYTFCLKYFSFEEELSEMLSRTYTGLHVKGLLFLSDYNQISILSTDIRRILTYKV